MLSLAVEINIRTVCNLLNYVIVNKICLQLHLSGGNKYKYLCILLLLTQYFTLLSRWHSRQRARQS